MDQDHGILIDSDFGEVNSAEDSFPHQGTKKAVKRMKFLEEFTSSIEVSNAKIGVNRYLVDTITSQLDAKSNHGFDLTEKIRSNKEFHNPYILKKVVDFFAIDEIGSNYPKEVFEPHGYNECEFEESIRKRSAASKSSSVNSIQNNQLSSAISALQQRGVVVGAVSNALIEAEGKKRNRWG